MASPPRHGGQQAAYRPDAVRIAQSEDRHLQRMQKVVQRGTPAQKSEMFEEIFVRFDVDQTGELEYEEFKQVLAYMGFRMKDDAVMELFKEVDTDDSGKIDINEFIKFFEIWEDYDKMNRYVNRQKKQGLMKSRIFIMYIMVCLLLLCTLIFYYISTGNQQYLVGIYILGAIVIGTFLVVTVFPVLKMKFGPAIQAKYRDWKDQKEMRKISA